VPLPAGMQALAPTAPLQALAEQPLPGSQH
jgi:hypothetical protein